MTLPDIRAFAQFSRNDWTYSEQLDNAVWTKVECTIDDNAIECPDGVNVTADKIIESVNNDAHGITRNTPTLTANKDQCFTFYAKADERSWLYWRTTDKAGDIARSWINLATGALGTEAAGHDNAVVSCGSGWYRISCIWDSGTGATTPDVGFGLATQDNETAYDGDGASGLHLWGIMFQVDQDFAALYTKTIASAVPAYVEISDYLIRWSFSEGRNYPSSVYGQAEAGQMDIALDNTDGRFSRFNTSGPYYGHLLHRRRIALFCYYPAGGYYFPLTCKYLDGIEERAVIGERKEVAIRALGPIAFLNDVEVSVAMQTSVTTLVAANAIFAAAGFPDSYGAYGTDPITMSRWWVDRLTALNAIRELEQTDNGFMIERQLMGFLYSGTVITGMSSGALIEYYDHTYYESATGSTAEFSDDPANAVGRFLSIEPIDNMKQVANVVKADVTPYTVGALAVLWTLGEIPSIAAGGSITLWAWYDPAVDAWTTPAATTDWTANAAADGGGADKTGSVSVVATKFSNSMKLVFSNADAGTVYLRPPAGGAGAQARGTPVVEGSTATVTAEDAASQAKYGGSYVYKIEAKWLPDTATAKAHADAVLALTKEPTPIVRLLYSANVSDYNLNCAIFMYLSLVLTLTANNAAGTGISGDFRIESRRLSGDENREMEVEYMLSQVPA